MKLIISILTILFTLASCKSNVNCEQSAESARETECLLIFEKLPAFTSPFLNAEGKHLITKKDCTCEDNARWWMQYDDLLEKGDTIIKHKGELVFSIHKKDTVLSFNWECQGKIYN